MKNLILKIDPKKALGIGSTVLSVASTLLSSKVASNKMDAMKEQLKKEILEELSKGKG